jgi:membrane protease YdiL (CAAX protease family)
MEADTMKSEPKREALYVLIYFAIYLGYLLVNPENEWLHWLTLVGLPLLWLILYYRKTKPASFGYILGTCGLKKENWKTGMGWALIIGLAISALQLIGSQRVDELLGLIKTGKVVLLLPLTFGLLLVTAGFTEEFFFRGVMLTRLNAGSGSKFWGVVISALLFGLYHFPYAYLHPGWPSYGDLGGALLAALGEGVPAGILLGIVYVKTNNNLVASVLVHTMINWLPAMTMLKLG